jgi:hypothetical protein
MMKRSKKQKEKEEQNKKNKMRERVKMMMFVGWPYQSTQKAGKKKQFLFRGTPAEIRKKEEKQNKSFSNSSLVSFTFRVRRRILFS